MDLRAICATCGHTQEWHDAARARAKLGGDPGVERPCFREIGGTSCRCSGFKDSGEIAAPALGAATYRPMFGNRGLFNAGFAVLVVLLLGITLLYAYRAQTPAVQSYSMTEAIQDINAGRVRTIVVVEHRATLELRTGEKRQTTLPDRDETLTRAVLDYNAAHPGSQITLRFEESGNAIGVLGSIVLSLLPVVLIALFFFALMARARGRYL